jgi:hypothetical protein
MHRFRCIEFQDRTPSPPRPAVAANLMPQVMAYAGLAGLR